MSYHLAQLNIARLHAPIDHPDSAAFVDGLDPINTLAEGSDGFVWRLTDENGQSSSYVESPAAEDPRDIINLSVWRDVESLHAFVFTTAHTGFLRRRREWFEPPAKPAAVCWWVPAVTVPTLEEALERLELFRREGSSAAAFALTKPFPSPGG